MEKYFKLLNENSDPFQISNVVCNALRDGYSNIEINDEDSIEDIAEKYCQEHYWCSLNNFRFKDDVILGVKKFLGIEESLNERIEKQPDVNYKGFDIVHFPITWKLADGNEIDQDGWTIKAPAEPQYCVAGDCQFRLPMRCHDEQYGPAIDFKSLEQCKDWIDKFGDNYEIRISHKEIHAYPKTKNENLEENDDMNLKEDLIRDNRAIQDPMRYLFRNSGVDTSGRIDSFVEIRDDYNDNTLYQALTSMFMRVCINLHHRNDIVDMGWKYADDERVAWNFRLGNKYFVFTSTPDSFDVYKSTNGRDYYKVIHANHSHCTNANDVRTVLDDDQLGYGDGQAPVERPHVEVDRVREVVRNAVSNELRQTVTNAVRAEVERSVRGEVGGSIRGAFAGGSIPGIVSNISRDGHGVEVNEDFINRIVDAVIRALQENHII